MIAVLWDLDGTLIDTSDLHVHAFGEALKRLGIYDERLVTEFRKRLGRRFADIVREIMPWYKDIEELARIRRRIVFSSLHLIKPLPASRILPEVHSKFPTALVTSSNREFVNAVLDHFGWRKYFDALVTGDDVRRGKPDPEPVLKALKILGVREGVMIGDSEYDRLCAERAGIRFIHVSEVERIWEVV